MTTTERPIHILLMTATITPLNAPVLTRTNPVDRLHDYQGALDSYLDLIDRPLDKIVFVENSDSDVTTLREMAERRNLSGRVEFLCNYGQHAYCELGRPYGEMKLLDYAMANSEAIRDAGEDAIVWKITGRYIIKNLGEGDRPGAEALRPVLRHEEPS